MRISEIITENVSFVKVPDEVAELAENFADDQIDEGARQTIMAFAVVGGLLLGGAIGVKDYKLTQEWMQTYEEIKETDPARADEIKKLVTKYKSYPLKLSGMKELTKQEIENIIANAAPKNVEENFADGKVKGKSRPGRVKRAGASCNGSVTDLRAKAKKYSGERGKMYHWCANMKAGKKK